MIKFAKEISSKLKGGEVLALTGDLGSGKTTFTKGLAKGLDIKENITSPTFVLLKQYKVRVKSKSKRNKTLTQASVSERPLTLTHIDCYRMKSVEDALSIGITDYIGKSENICVIEWSEIIDKLLPKDTIRIKFEHVDENKRKVSICNI